MATTNSAASSSSSSNNNSSSNSNHHHSVGECGPPFPRPARKNNHFPKERTNNNNNDDDDDDDDDDDYDSNNSNAEKRPINLSLLSPTVIILLQILSLCWFLGSSSKKTATKPPSDEFQAIAFPVMDGTGALISHLRFFSFSPRVRRPKAD